MQRSPEQSANAEGGRAPTGVAGPARLFLDAPDPVVVEDLEGRIVEANREALRAYGWTREELLGRPVRALTPPEHREALDVLVRRCRRGEEVRSTPAFRQDRAGKAIPVRLTLVLLRDEGGAHAGIVSFARDVSALRDAQRAVRESEAQLRRLTERDLADREALEREQDVARTLFDTAQAIVLVLDPAGRIVRFNPYMEQLTGYRLSEVQGRDWFSTFIPEHERRRIRRVFADSTSGVRTRGNVNAIVTRSGSERVIQWFDAELRGHDGELGGILAVGHDITDRVEAERALAQSERRARAAEEVASVGTLTAGLAHDIGTPMNVIMGYARLLESSVHDEEGRKRLRTIHDQVQRIATLVQTLLGFARPHETRRIPVALEDVLEKALSFVQEKLRERTIEVERRLEPVPVVQGDPEKLQQVFLNLFLNAADAMPSGGRLLVELARGPRASIQVRVADSGIGIPKDRLERIFEPFYTTKRRGEGTGLGLVVCRSIVADHGGRIDVASEPGKGTEFVVAFPGSPEGQRPAA